MKEAYSKPVVDVKEFHVTDVIATSGVNGPEIIEGEGD